MHGLGYLGFDFAGMDTGLRMNFQDLLLYARSLVKDLKGNDQLPLYCLSQELVDATSSHLDYETILRTVKHPMLDDNAFVNTAMSLESTIH